MTTLDSYKVEHLFLLVGENPLPNYIAARTLLEDGGTVYLVFTEHTIKQEECLVECLKKGGTNPIQEQQLEPVDLEDRESDSDFIRKTIQQIIKPLTGKIGLHYTGGTKAMAVHAYRAVQENKPDAVFSYLDSRRLEMCIDRKNDQPIRKKIPLELSLEKLFKLHNLPWQEKKPPSLDAKLPDAAADFADFHKYQENAEAWRAWCENEMKPKMKPGKNWANESVLKQQPILDISSLPPEIKNILCKNLDACQEKLELSLTKTKNKGFKKLKHIGEWLDGIWLEDYVLEQVKNVSKKYPINDIRMSFHIEDQNSESTEEKFEFDVAFMLGYQLFAISCTTDSTKVLCKSKLFEAYLRARQLGGDEARVALVCCYDKPDELKAELITTIDNRKIQVFGRKDLEQLSEKIAEWIEENNQEANK
ncbi:DUF1887 family protein [Phormidium pseudopriestleyi FRX01]|uniref:DUF1887 family protein n=1 Tax=Phormidium pseudopriestleyi FRX01 TaxID=1759528 RepID=A0ABS3FN61_9CYAN|nr:DUF1887 family CARF protein [Phormidium pseudopriestleyi]MBO0348515.1 DUF1887 family protein [Phormidium pseudopriestleyi FRX01]